MKNFTEFLVELSQGPQNVTKDITKSDEKNLEPRPPGEKSIYADYLRKMKTQDYPVKVKNQQKSDMPTANLPHEGEDRVPGEKKNIKQGSSNDSGGGTVTSKSQSKSFGEIRAVMQGSSKTDSSSQIKEGIGDADVSQIEKFKMRHKGKTPQQVRKMLRRKGLKPWQANELRLLAH